jgi:hypothetical protein
MTFGSGLQEQPSLLVQGLHGFWGAVAGVILGRILTAVLPPLAGSTKGILILGLGVLGCSLAFRHGSQF